MIDVRPPAETATTAKSDAELLRRIDALLPAVYDEAHGLVQAILQRCERIDATRATSLINDT